MNSANMAAAIDAVGFLPRRARNNALLDVHGTMLAASVPAGHWLWTMLQEAYEALS